VAGSPDKAPMFLCRTTKLDPMTYVLFGAYRIAVTAQGLECDGWLPVVGNVYALDDIQKLKVMMEGCMCRVFEGLAMRKTHFRPRTTTVSPLEEESGDEEEDETGHDPTDRALSTEEVEELDCLTGDIVSILNRYADERMGVQPRSNSGSASPMGLPRNDNTEFPSSGTSSGTPLPHGVRPITLVPELPVGWFDHPVSLLAS